MIEASSSLQTCPHCEAVIDVGDRDPLDVFVCPGCGGAVQIHGEIGVIQLVDVLGRGGMGVVYRAYDPSLDRYIAIKVLRKDRSSDAEFVTQLETEATITAAINDPNVVRVYATGFDRGRFYLAMELVDGGSLDDLIREQMRVPEVLVLKVGIQIARGLRAAYGHGLIHRDVKPGNILFGNVETAKIVDFGLAAFVDEMEGVSNEVWGTPYYLAPEKLDGGMEDLRSDIYSLGGTLFHALAGRPPFEAKTATLVAFKHLKSQAVSLQTFAPWVSGPTTHIINKTLLKNPAERYQSYDDLIHNLEYALDQLQKSPGGVERKRVVMETEEEQRSRTWLVLGMTAAIVLILGFVFFQSRSSKSPSPVANQVASAPSEAATSSAVSEGMLKPEVDALVAGDANAAELLKAASADSSRPVIDRAWAQMLVGAAHLLAGRGLDARTAFDQVGEFTTRMKDEQTAAFLRAISRRLAKGEVVPEGEALKLNSETYEAIGFFLYGLNNWQLGQVDNGAFILRQFRSCEPKGRDAWVGKLKSAAITMLEERTAFEMAESRLKQATNAGERIAAAAALRKFAPAFASRVEVAVQPYAREMTSYEEALNEYPQPGGLYKVVNKRTGKLIQVDRSIREDKAKIVLWRDRGGLNQLWELMRHPRGAYHLTALHSGRSLDVPSGKNVRGLQLQQYSYFDADPQKWWLDPKGEGCYFVRSVATNQVMAVNDMQSQDGSMITQWNEPGSPDHYWKFDKIGERSGDWIITEIGGSTSPGTNTVPGKTLRLTVNALNGLQFSDSCRFVSRLAADDFDLVARLVECSTGLEWSKTGLMVRFGIDSNSAHHFFGIASNHGLFQQGRLVEESNISQDPVKEGVKGPIWMRISRRGSTYSTFVSPDGVKWLQLGSQMIGTPIDACLVGIASSAGVGAGEFTSSYDSISFNPAGK